MEPAFDLWLWSGNKRREGVHESSLCDSCDFGTMRRTVRPPGVDELAIDDPAGISWQFCSATEFVWQVVAQGVIGPALDPGLNCK